MPTTWETLIYAHNPTPLRITDDKGLNVVRRFERFQSINSFFYVKRGPLYRTVGRTATAATLQAAVFMAVGRLLFI